jgi:hypothetical protein
MSAMVIKVGNDLDDDKFEMPVRHLNTYIWWIFGGMNLNLRGKS